MKSLLATLILLMTSTLTLADQSGPLKPEYDITRAVIEVVWYEHEWQIAKSLNLNREVGGVSDCDWRPEKNIVHCIIHVVRPKHVDDVHTLVLGHEVAHAFFGFYHDQPPTYINEGTP